MNNIDSQDSNSLINAVGPSSLMVDFPAEKFLKADEIESARGRGSLDQEAAMPEAAIAVSEPAPKEDVPMIEAPQIEAPQLPAEESPAPSAPWFCILPVILFGAVSALIPDSMADIRSGLGTLLAMVSLFALIVCAIIKRVKIRRGIFNIAFICCAAALIISYLLSPYKETALFGAEGSMEGTIFLLSCVSVMFCAVNVMQGKAALLISVWTASAVFAARGVFSALGYFGSEIGRTDIVLLSGGACLIFTLFAGQLCRRKFTGSVISFILWAALLVLTAAAVRNDLISFAASVCASVIILAAVHIRTLRAFAKPALLFLLAAAFVLIPTWDNWMQVIRSQDMENVSRVPISSFTTEGNTAKIYFEGGTALRVKTEATEDGRFTKAEFMNRNGEPLTLSEDKNEAKMYLIDEEPYHSFIKLCIIRNNDADLLRIETSGFAWDLATDGSSLYCLNSLGEADIPGSNKPLDLATGCRYLRERRAVQSCALDLSQTYAQYGCGADCFGIVYPPDRVYRYNSGLDASAKTEDPKSLYMLAGIQTGRVTLCAFSAAAVIYAALYISGLRGGRSFADGRPERAAVFAAIVCLALSGITNSPKAGTLPLFFVLLGTGLAAEYKK